MEEFQPNKGGHIVISGKTCLRRALAVSAALAVVGAGTLAVAQTAAAATGTSTTSAPMHTVAVTGLVATVPDAAGKVKVRLANGDVITIPAADKDRVMARAAQEAKANPNGVVSGDCGSSNITVQEKADAHPVHMTTGFTVVIPAISYAWQATIAGPDDSYVFQQSGGLFFRDSWTGTFDSTDDDVEGTYNAAVVADQSWAELWTGDICFSGGPTDTEFLTSPDAPESHLATATAVTDPAKAQVADAGPLTVFPPDTRTLVPDTTVYPNSPIARVISFFPNGEAEYCSGFLYGADTLATAGHCVYNKAAGGWAKSMQVTPARYVDSSGTPQTPYGVCNGTEYFTSEGWLNNADEAYDYGAAKLDCQAGNATGLFGLSWPSGSIARTNVTVTGYPTDKTTPAGSMWTANGPIIWDNQRQAFHQISTFRGQSGSPVFAAGCTTSCQVIAIQARGAGGFHPHTNAATRITQANSVDFLAWAS